MLHNGQPGILILEYHNRKQQILQPIFRALQVSWCQNVKSTGVCCTKDECDDDDDGGGEKCNSLRHLAPLKSPPPPSAYSTLSFYRLDAFPSTQPQV